MRKLLPFALVLCSGLSIFAADILRPGTIALLHPGITAPPRPDTTIYIHKDTALRRYPVIRLEWQMLVNGFVAQKGVIPLVTLSSKHPTAVPIPAKFTSGNDEVILRLIYRRPSSGRSTNSAPLLTRTIPIRPWKGDYSIPPTGDIAFTDSGDLFTVTSPNALFRFDKQSGWLLAYETNHLILVDDSTGLRPSIWPLSIAQPRLQLFSTSTGSQLAIVRAEYTLPEVSCLLHMSYTINAAGDMLVGQSLEADSAGKGPALPRFGMTWLLPPGFDSATCYAPPEDTLSAEIFHTALSTIPPTNVRWMTITTSDNKAIRIAADSAFLILHPDGKGFSIQRPAPSKPLPYGSYQYSFKISPLPPALHPRPLPSRTTSASRPLPH